MSNETQLAIAEGIRFSIHHLDTINDPDNREFMRKIKENAILNNINLSNLKEFATFIFRRSNIPECDEGKRPGNSYKLTLITQINGISEEKNVSYGRNYKTLVDKMYKNLTFPQTNKTKIMNEIKTKGVSVSNGHWTSNSSVAVRAILRKINH
tara:strand:- start:928 stop:1386 length:459 start_codon:yes stop_codon:yes gene_type:complete